MATRRIAVAVSLLAMCLLSLGSAQAGDKIKGKGVITLRSGNNLTVETDDDAAVTVIVTADTKIQHLVGLGARKKQVSQDVLIPGLKLKYEGTGDQTQVTADTITFNRDDLSLAKVIQAGFIRRLWCHSDMLYGVTCVESSGRKTVMVFVSTVTWASSVRPPLHSIVAGQTTSVYQLG